MTRIGARKPVRRMAGHTESAALFTELIFNVFRAYNRINMSGDKVAADFGLTSARWRVLGSILPAAKSVAQIARERGLTRQSVQQIANALVKDGLAVFIVNERHKSSHLLAPTPRARDAIERLNEAQVAWANKIADGLDPSDLRVTMATLRAMIARLETR